MSISEWTGYGVGGAWIRSPNRRARAFLGGIAAVAVTLGFWVVSGTLGLVGGGVLLVAWAVLPATYAFAIGQIAFIAVTRPETLSETGLLIPVLVEVGLVGVLVGPAIQSPRGRQTAGWTLLGTAVLGGIALGSYAFWDQLWIAATVLVGLSALVTYGFHRYELVVLGKVPDPGDINPEGGVDSDEDNLDLGPDPDVIMDREGGYTPNDDGVGADDDSKPDDEGLGQDDERDPNHEGGTT